MANGAAAVARLDNWFWTSSPPTRDVLSGEIFDDSPPCSWPDGAYTTTRSFAPNKRYNNIERVGAGAARSCGGQDHRDHDGPAILAWQKAATHASLAAAAEETACGTMLTVVDVVPLPEPIELAGAGAVDALQLCCPGQP